MAIEYGKSVVRMAHAGVTGTATVPEAAVTYYEARGWFVVPEDYPAPEEPSLESRVAALEAGGGGGGDSWLTGATAPSGAEGTEGDMHLLSTTGEVRKKTGPATWTVVANLKGATGSQGLAGAAGPAGGTGPQGPAGVTVAYQIVFAAETAAIQATPSNRAPQTRLLQEARMRCQGAPVGSDLVAQVQTQVQGSGTWTTIGTLTITAGTTTEQVLTLAVQQAIGGKVRLNVTSVGSTTPASRAVVEILTSAVAA